MSYDDWKARQPEERWVDHDRTSAAHIDLPAERCAIDPSHLGPFTSHPDRPLLCHECKRIADAIDIMRKVRQQERRAS